MKAIIFGATGMVGQSALRACLTDPNVSRVLTVGRSLLGLSAPKLEDAVAPDLFDLASYQDRLVGYDACFYCLGRSAAGMDEAAYTRITYELTLQIAQTLAKLNPGMTFVYVSGAGTDSTEKGSLMWARIKGRTENALQRLPFKAAYMFRPGMIQPLDGIRSKTPSYRILYSATKPLLSALRAIFPKAVLTTDNLGRAMISAAQRGAPKAVLGSSDIYLLAQQ